MKKIGVLWLFLMGIALSARSQITITNSVFPIAGDTSFYVFDHQPGPIPITPPGGNQQWDFSNLQVSQTWEQVFKAPQSGVGAAAFPDASLMYKTLNTDREAYLNVSNNNVSLLGLFPDDPIGLGISVTSRYTPPIVQSRAPLNFFDINQTSSGLLLPFSPDIVPGTILNQLPVQPDSLRIRIAVNVLEVVDGWGNLTIPGGIYEVLRVKKTEYRETRLDAKVPPLGWLDITDIAIQALNLTVLGVDTTVTLHFLNNQSKEAIAICTLNNEQSQVVMVQYKNVNNNGGGGGMMNTYYRDMDGDGFGDPFNTTQGVSVPGGYVTNDTDCDDTDALEKPGQVWYKDTDGDDYSNGMTLTQCLRPANYFVAGELTATHGDCNDAVAAINPAATEICDGIDNNCNGMVDENGGTTGGAWSSGDVGTADGDASFPPCNAEPNDVFTLNATGFSTSSSDNIQAVYQELCENGEIIGRVLNVQNGGWAGIMLRETLNPGSKKASLKTQLTSTIRREIRNVTNGAASILNFSRPQHVWLRLVRNGSNFVGYTSANGAAWSFAFSATISMPGCIYAGIFSESINASVTTTATFNNVKIIGTTNPLIQAPQTPEAASIFSPEVYPNPTTGEVNIDLSGYANPVGTVKVFDAYGKLVMQQQLDGSHLFGMKIDRTDGVYFLSINVEGEAPVTKRVVVAH